jgi:hypothetical protein
MQPPYLRSLLKKPLTGRCLCRAHSNAAALEGKRPQASADDNAALTSWLDDCTTHERDIMRLQPEVVALQEAVRLLSHRLHYSI